ncbi:MAG: response regulator [Thermoanaerobaculia bacterium]|nr:response regulator [Thermoanaerobaculia bacterium]
MLSGRLTSLGYSFDMASDVSEAIRQIRRESYAALLLDVTLPDVDGKPVLRYLREQAEARDVPILLLSTIDAIPQAVEFLGDGADELVPQPFRTQELKIRLQSVLDSEPRPAAAPSEDRRRAEHLLKVMLPDPLIEELRKSSCLPPRREDEVAVMSWDVPDLDERLMQDTEGAAQAYQRLLVAFEIVSEEHRVHTLRTAGDGVLAVAGRFSGADDPVGSVVKLAAELRNRASELTPDWLVRIGVHTGPATLAVVGHRSCQLGVWGQPVKVSRRLRNLCRTTTVLASSEVWDRCAGKAQGVQAGTAELKEGPPSPVFRIDSMKS